MPRTDAELAADLYPGLVTKPPAEGVAAEPEQTTEEVAARIQHSDEELGKVLWPEKNPQLAGETEGGHVLDTLRDDTGRIIGSGDWSGQRDKLLQSKGAYADGVQFENEKIGVEVKDASVRSGSFDGTTFEPGTGLVHSDARRASFRNVKADHASFRDTDLRGSVWSGASIAFADFAGCKIDQAAWDSLKGAEGFKSAVNLGRPVED